MNRQVPLFIRVIRVIRGFFFASKGKETTDHTDKTDGLRANPV